MKTKKDWIIIGLFLASLLLGYKSLNLAGVNKHLKHKFKSNQEEVIQAKRRISQLSMLNTSLNSEIEKLNAQIEGFPLSLQSKEEENKRLKEQMATLNIDFDGLKRALVNFESEFQKNQELKLIDSLKQENKAFKNVNQELQKEIRLFQGQLIETDKEFSSMQRDMQEFDRRLKDKDEELAKKEEEIGLLKDELAKVRSEKDVIKVGTEAIKAELDTATKAAVFLNNKSMELDRSLSEKSSQLAKLQEEIEALRSQRNSLQEELSSSLASQKQANGQLIQTMQTISLLQDRFKGLSELLENKSPETKSAAEVNLPKIEILIPRTDIEAKGKTEGRAGSSGSKEKHKTREEAIECYNNGLKYAVEENYKKAEESFLKAIKINPEDADSCYNLAIIYDDHLGNKKKAAYYYRKYLELRPDSEDRDMVMEWLRKTDRNIKKGR
ncbi:MAG: tetratricopeptide repeat protein [Candidatus Omnitrophica bacterium]|nr:tetratricopeptide repeat protein [Candidatus Omnitrophota bacterium]MBU1933107.1 tetratricopeptide repeat protein [Candidatus Omnitrophota bacterium]